MIKPIKLSQAKLNDRGLLSDIILEQLTCFTRIGQLSPIFLNSGDELTDSILSDLYVQLKSEYEQLPRLLRTINQEHQDLVSLVEIGSLSKNLIAAAWYQANLHLDDLREISEEPTQEELSGALQDIATVLFKITETFEPREKLFRQGDKGDKVYLVKSGELDIILEERFGNTKLATIGPGAVFGEMAIIDNNPRSATIYAKDAVTVYSVTKTEFDKLITDTSDLKTNVTLMAYVVNIMRSRINFISTTNDLLRTMVNLVEAGARIEEVEAVTHPTFSIKGINLPQFEFKVAPTSLYDLISTAQKKYQQAHTLKEMGDFKESFRLFCEIDTYYELPKMCSELNFTSQDYTQLRDTIMNNGLLSGMFRFGRWNSEHSFRNRRFLIDIMDKADSEATHYMALGDMILSQHPKRKITKKDCDLAIRAYAKASELGALDAEEKIKQVMVYADNKGIKLKENGIELSGNEVFQDLNEYQPTPGIDNLVENTSTSVAQGTFNLKYMPIVIDFQRACALEPLPDKRGCTTRFHDLSTYQKLSQFVLSGVNLGYAIFDLLAKIEKHKSVNENSQPSLIYDSCYNMQVLSKMNRRGGRLNQGIIEFGFPIIVAMALYDPNREHSVDYVLRKANDVLNSTTPEDVAALVSMKQFAYVLSRVERDVAMHDVSTVFDYYSEELKQAEESKNINSIVHNRQFVNGFQDIKLVYDTFQNTEGDFNQKVVAAYEKVFEQPSYKEIGKGLAADFIAVGLFLTLAYNKDKEIVW